MEQSYSLSDGTRSPVVEVSLVPYQEAFARVVFLSTVISSTFVALPLVIALWLRSSPLEALVTIVTFFIVIFPWLWALARISRLLAVYSFLLAATTILLEGETLLEGTWRPYDWTGQLGQSSLTLIPLLFSIIPAWFGLRVALDGLSLLFATASETAQLVTIAPPGVTGFGQVISMAFGIHPICAWLPRAWQRNVARCLFLVCGMARGFAIISLIIDLVAGSILMAFKAVLIGGSVTAALRSLARRFARVSVEQLVSVDPRSPVLFLRSFQDDQVRLELAWTRKGGFRDMVTVADPKPTLDHVVLEETTLLGPVLAIGAPGQPPPFGIARTYLDHDEWKAEVAILAKKARAIIIVLDDTVGVKWEHAHIENSGYSSKTLYLFPPRLTVPPHSARFLYGTVFDPKAAKRQGHAGDSPFEQLTHNCIGWFRMSDGRLVLLTSGVVNMAAYVCAVRMYCEHQLHGYVPHGVEPNLVRYTPVSDDDPGHNIEALFKAEAGIVVRLKDGRALVPVDGKYTLFGSLEEYRRFTKDDSHWFEILNKPENSQFFSAARTLVGEMIRQ